MSRRPNARQLKFCALVVKGATLEDAVIGAGYKAADPGHMGKVMLRTDTIRTHLERWQKQLERRVNVELVDVINEMKPIAFSNITDYLEEAPPLRDAEGKVIKGQDQRYRINLDLANRDEQGAIRKLKFYPDGSVSLELFDKRAALMDLGRHLGMRLGRVQVEAVAPMVRPDLSILDADEREALRKIADKLERAQRAPQIENDSTPASGDAGDDEGNDDARSEGDEGPEDVA